MQALTRSVATAGVLGLALIGLTANPAGAATTVPFADVVAGTVTATSPSSFALAGSGIASSLGAVRYSGTVTVTSAPGAATLTDTLTETLTAANGDSITIVCQQSATLVPGTTNVLHGKDTWTVVKGVGKYRNARGSGTGDTYVYNLQAFAKTATGSITFRRGGRWVDGPGRHLRPGAIGMAVRSWRIRPIPTGNAPPPGST
jgi:hypothetical protein